MLKLIGEYECKLDGKSRLLFPSALKKQIPTPDEELSFVLNRGFEPCLTLHTSEVWNSIIEDINNLDDYVEKHRELKRYFYNGAQILTLDSANRLLLPKGLLEFAGIEKEIILFAYSNKIEIWDTKKYKSLFTNVAANFSRLAEEVMSKKDKNNTNNVS